MFDNQSTICDLNKFHSILARANLKWSAECIRDEELEIGRNIKYSLRKTDSKKQLARSGQRGRICFIWF